MYADFPCKVYSTNTTRPYLRTFIVESTIHDIITFIVESTIKQRGSRNVVPDETTKHILMEEKQKLKKKKIKKKINNVLSFVRDKKKFQKKSFEKYGAMQSVVFLLSWELQPKWKNER